VQRFFCYVVSSPRCSPRRRKRYVILNDCILIVAEALENKASLKIGFSSVCAPCAREGHCTMSLSSSNVSMNRTCIHHMSTFQPSSFDSSHEYVLCFSHTLQLICSTEPPPQDIILRHWIRAAFVSFVKNIIWGGGIFLGALRLAAECS
jgi:hypothetical protein